MDDVNDEKEVQKHLESKVLLLQQVLHAEHVVITDDVVEDYAASIGVDDPKGFVFEAFICGYQIIDGWVCEASRSSKPVKLYEVHITPQEHEEIEQAAQVAFAKWKLNQ